MDQWRRRGQARPLLARNNLAGLPAKGTSSSMTRGQCLMTFHPGMSPAQRGRNGRKRPAARPHPPTRDKWRLQEPLTVSDSNPSFYLALRNQINCTHGSILSPSMRTCSGSAHPRSRQHVGTIEYSSKPVSLPSSSAQPSPNPQNFEGGIFKVCFLLNCKSVI